MNLLIVLCVLVIGAKVADSQISASNVHIRRNVSDRKPIGMQLYVDVQGYGAYVRLESHYQIFRGSPFYMSECLRYWNRTDGVKSESAEAASNIYGFPFHNRSTWGAREAKDVLPLVNPVSYIIIHDSGEPPAIEIAGCANFTSCSQSMKNIQNMHMDDNGWWDIGYNFAIGGDGGAYEGRGWNVLGAHAKYLNTISIGICLIGEFTSKLPTLVQLNGLNGLVAAGVKMGYIHPDYRLVPHSQVRNTTCPGKKLMKKVQTWLHYSNFPGSPRDLLDIPEISESAKEEIKKDLVTDVVSAFV